MNLQQRLDTRNTLLKKANSPQEATRLQALDGLGRGGFCDLEVLQFLRVGLGSTNHKEVIACAKNLYALQGDMCTPWIIEAILQMKRPTARKIVYWLVEQSHRSARELSRLLEAPDEMLYAMISVPLCEQAPDIVFDWCNRRLPQQNQDLATRALSLALQLFEEGWKDQDKATRRQRRNEVMTLLLQQQEHSIETIRQGIEKAFHQLQDNDSIYAAAFRLPVLDRAQKLQVLKLLDKKGRSKHADCVEGLLGEQDEEVFLEAMRVIYKLDASRRHHWFKCCLQSPQAQRFAVAIEIAKNANDTQVWEDLKEAYVIAPDATRVAALEALCNIFPRFKSKERSSEFRALLRICAKDALEGVREVAFSHLVTVEKHVDKEIFLCGISDQSSLVRQLSLQGLQQCDKEAARTAAIKLSRDGLLLVQQAAYDILFKDTEACPNKVFLQACRHDDETLQQKAAAYLRTLPEENFRQLLVALLTTQREVVEVALQRMQELYRAEEQLSILKKSLHQAHPNALDVLLKALFAQSTQAWADLESSFAHMQSKVRVSLAQHLGQEQTDTAHALLLQCLEDENEDVRMSAFEALASQPKDIYDLALRMRNDEDQRIRVAAVKKIRVRQDETTLAFLLPMARDESPEVRHEVIDALAHYDDPEVLSELISSVHDVNENVRNLAKEILQRGKEVVPSLRHARRGWLWEDDTLPRNAPVWQRLHQQVDEVRMWASRVGQLLLGVPVIVHQYRQGLGRTWKRSKDGVVEIELADSPITQGHPFGDEIVKGLALHEIGHHLYDFGVRGFSTVRGIARSEGLGGLFDILLDERLERRLRSRRPMWGIYFDRLASYAFAQRWHRLPLQELADFLERPIEEIREEIERGDLPGYLVEEGEILTEGRMFARFFGGKGRRLEEHRISDADSVLLRDSDLLRIPGALLPNTAFLWCLRCGFDPAMSSDPRIAQAINLVQGDFRHLDHAGLLQLSRDIVAIFEKDEDGARESEENRRKKRKEKLVGLRHLRSIMQRVQGRMRDVGIIPSQGQTTRCAGSVRKQEREIIYERKQQESNKGEGGQTLHLGAQIDFPLLEKVSNFDRNVTEQIVMIKKVQPFVRTMRAYFERLGRKTVDEYASRRGRRLDMGQIRSACFRPNLNVLVHSEEIQTADLYIGLLIDRSGSMSGTKLETAKAFGALLCESAKGLRGIQGHVHAFDDDTWYPLGSFEKNNIASLTSGGANNDAGALLRAANLALQSKKRQKLLIMISDGSPTECSVHSLKKLVEVLGQDHNILCAQAAVETLPEIAFPHYVDLSQYRFGDAVQRFGKLLMRMTQAAVR